MRAHCCVIRTTRPDPPPSQISSFFEPWVAQVFGKIHGIGGGRRLMTRRVGPRGCGEKGFDEAIHQRVAARTPSGRGEGGRGGEVVTLKQDIWPVTETQITE